MERRGEYFNQLERKLFDSAGYPLVSTVKQCLENIPSERPSIEQTLTVLEEIRVSIEGPYGPVVRIESVKQVVMMKILKVKEEELREKEREIQQFQVQTEQIQV